LGARRLVYIAVFISVLILMPFTIKFAWKIGAIDVPRDWRRMHKKSLPRNGGLAIGFAFLLGCSFLNASLNRNAACLIVGGVVILLAGLVDDVKGLSALVKLMIQISAATGVVFLGNGLRGWESVWAIVWVVALTNAHNLIDGLDGLFCGTSAIEATALGGLLWSVGERTNAQLAWCLGAACLGFFVFNRHPAKIFAGDCGSGSVGFWLGVLSLPIFQHGATYGVSIAPIFLFVYPLTDLFAAVLRRLLRGKSPFAADRGHLHHRICDAGVSCVICVRLLLLLCAGFCGIALLIDGYHFYAVASLHCMLMAALLVLIRKKITKGLILHLAQNKNTRNHEK